MSTAKQKSCSLFTSALPPWVLTCLQPTSDEGSQNETSYENWFAALLLAVPMGAAFASGGHAHYEKVDIDLRDQVSLQRGAQIFTNYCLSCHSASGMRFNRLKDIGLTDEEIKKT